MAGIGFVLRKLMSQNNLSSYLTAYFHSMMASAGPWIVTILPSAAFFSLESLFQLMKPTLNFA